MDATVIQSILDVALGQGIWCGLFVYLFWDSRRRNETREKELMQIISKYGDNFKEITDILSKIKDEFGYYINYRTISGIGKIFIFKPDRVEMVRNKKKIKLDIVLGVTIKGFEKGSDFNALLNPLAIS